MNQLNEYGVPLHACHGYRQDEHYWAWVSTWCGDGSGVRPAVIVDENPRGNPQLIEVK